MTEVELLGLSCHDVAQVFATRSGSVEALANVSFHMRSDEFVCIVGPSGCGKSTLLKIVAGLLRPTSGAIVFETSPARQVPRAAMVFQEHALFPWMTLVDNVAFGLEVDGIPERARRERAKLLLRQVGLERFSTNYPHELSVGMRQRAAIARALLTDPQLLLMDEPFSALDAQTKLVLQEELLRLVTDQRKTVIYVTHDIEEAVLLGDRVLVMSGHPGRIRDEVPIPLGRPRDLRDRERREAREIAWHIWKLIEQEVRQALLVPA
jgi:NitT/TauT family transport system ATP-binding protein